MESDIAYYLKAYPTFYGAVFNQHAYTTSCSFSASCCFVSSVEQEGQAMLPTEYHEQACQLFCRLLHRLETLENGENHNNSETDGSDPSTFMEGRPSHNIVCTNLSSREHTRAKKERFCRDAGR